MSQTNARPAIVTVDDDPAVSRSVARDLRRRYGERYRIVRADSGEDALVALREIRLRGDRVAALLADYRMPGLNGVDFLEQAMDLFPRARRALLTAYADTDAAISAINVVDVDHYLLKPWEPPEEKLYPVLDAMLDAWRASGDEVVSQIKLVGHRWSAPSHEVRDFLARNGVPYRWYSVEEPEGRRLLEAAGARPEEVPLVVPPTGTPLVAPTLAEVAQTVGLSTAAAQDFYDVVIVGGGPAGLGAAVYAASEGLRTVLVERRATGGQAGQSSRIENYLGFPDGISGGQLTERARRQAHRFGAEVLTAREVTALELRGSSRVVHFGDGGQLAAHAVILATGVAYRRLDAPGVDDFVGRGVFYGSADTEAPACAGDHVLVVGGANSAGQAAVFFSRHAERVSLVVRSPDLERSMSRYLIEQLRDTTTGLAREVASEHLFVFIGAAPMTDWVPAEVRRDDAGFLMTGPELVTDGTRPPGWTLDRDPYLLETSVPGVFAAGDVRGASVKRVASAVGEGALALTLVHRYLEHR